MRGDRIIFVLVDELDDSFQVSLHVVDRPDHHILDRCDADRVVDFIAEVWDAFVDLEFDDALLLDALTRAADVLRVPYDYGLFETGLLAFFI